MTDNSTATLLCPKCQGVMRTYERSGITIDQCQDCRGVFLDRGELDRLIDADAQRDPAPTRPPTADDNDRYDRSAGHASESKHGSKAGNKRRRGGFLGDLFDS